MGYVGVYGHQEGAYISILIDAGHRHRGLARRLVADVFEALPAGLEVEAWVGAFNRVSLNAMRRLGFHRERIIEDRGRRIHISFRESQMDRGLG